MRVRWLMASGVAAAVAPAAYATQYLSVEQAQRAAFAQAERFEVVAAPDAAAVAALGAPAGWAPRIFAARASGDALLGWLIVDHVLGKSELISYAVALDAHGSVLSVEVLDYRESHGGEIRLPAWRRQFVGKNATAAASLTGTIRNISGATLSCRHLTEGVQRLLRLHDAVLKAQAN